MAWKTPHVGEVVTCGANQQSYDRNCVNPSASDAKPFPSHFTFAIYTTVYSAYVWEAKKDVCLQSIHIVYTVYVWEAARDKYIGLGAYERNIACLPTVLLSSTAKFFILKDRIIYIKTHPLIWKKSS